MAFRRYFLSMAANAMEEVGPAELHDQIGIDKYSLGMVTKFVHSRSFSNRFAYRIPFQRQPKAHVTLDLKVGV
jgi:hypothetical protein